MGYLTKRGAVVKNWKKRYFVVNPDYSVDYFENEEVCTFLFIYIHVYCGCIDLVRKTQFKYTVIYKFSQLHVY